MPGPARSGVLIYAFDLDRLSVFYARLLAAAVLHEDADHQLLQSPDTQLIVHAIPAPYLDVIQIQTPPEPREEQAIKPFFSVADLAEAERLAVELGGLVLGPVWPGPGMKLRNVCDPEGNIVQLREFTA